MSRRLNIRREYGDVYSRNCGPGIASFDPASGLGFVETIYQGGPMRADWVYQVSGSVTPVSRYRKVSSRGAPKLRDTAIRSVCTNTYYLEPEALRSVPWTVAKDIWRMLMLHDLDSLHVWKVFAEAYANEDDAETLKFRSQRIAYLDMPLDGYVRPITSPAFQYITFLHLAGVACSRAELIELSQLRNLGALTIGPGVCTEVYNVALDDRILRSWSRAAAEDSGEKAFSRLKVLACRKQRALTPRAFHHLNDIRPIGYVILDNCGPGTSGKQEEAEVHESGFQPSEELEKAFLEDGKEPASWETLMRSLFLRCGNRGAKEPLAPSDQEDRGESKNSLPLLSMSLGSEQKPMTWAGAAGNDGLKCFERMKTGLRQVVQPGAGTHNFGPFQAEREYYKAGSQEFGKKRAVKATKQRDIGNSFSDFGL